MLKNSKTTPLRMVFDCSACESINAPSSNDCLHSGPSLINEMVSVLMRFRSSAFACFSDIEKAYLQIELCEENRDATRFLWPDDPFDVNSKINVYRFRVFFGATCSQFLLNLSLKRHIENSSGVHSESIADGLYVDNLIYSTHGENKLIDFY